MTEISSVASFSGGYVQFRIDMTDIDSRGHGLSVVYGQYSLLSRKVQVGPYVVKGGLS